MKTPQPVLPEALEAFRAELPELLRPHAQLVYQAMMVPIEEDGSEDLSKGEIDGLAPQPRNAEVVANGVLDPVRSD